MANRTFRNLKGSLTRELAILCGSFTTSTSGTIASQDSGMGFTIAKTATKTGRYTLTFADRYTKFRGGVVSIVGTTDAAYTAGKGLRTIWRNDNVTASATKTVDLQFVRGNGTTDYNDTEIEDAAVVHIEVFVTNAPNA